MGIFSFFSKEKKETLDKGKKIYKYTMKNRVECEETNSILMFKGLEWDVMAPVGVMCRCPNTYVHIVYVQ